MTPRNPMIDSEPVWELARLFPSQGSWRERDYLRLETNHLVEFLNGYLEFPPMPTMSHQLIVRFLSNALLAFATVSDLGSVLFAPFRVRIRPKEYREPDVMFMLAKHASRMHDGYWESADLVMEVVSGGADDRERDLVTKRAEYAIAGIAEYWTVDPRQKLITVLKLRGARYEVNGEYSPGERAASALLKGFEVDVDAVLGAAGRRRTGRT